MKLIDKVLATGGDPISVYDGLAMLCSLREGPVKALINKFKDNSERARLTFQQLEDAFANNIEKSNYELINDINADKFDLNLKEKFAASKAKTEVSDENFIKANEWVEKTLLTRSDEVKKYYNIANSFLQGFKDNAVNKGWFVPSNYQMYMAAELAD